MFFGCKRRIVELKLFMNLILSKVCLFFLSFWVPRCSVSTLHRVFLNINIVFWSDINVYPIFIYVWRKIRIILMSLTDRNYFWPFVTRLNIWKYLIKLWLCNWCNERRMKNHITSLNWICSFVMNDSSVFRELDTEVHCMDICVRMCINVNKNKHIHTLARTHTHTLATQLEPVCFPFRAWHLYHHSINPQILSRCSRAKRERKKRKYWWCKATEGLQGFFFFFFAKDLVLQHTAGRRVTPRRGESSSPRQK